MENGGWRVEDMKCYFDNGPCEWYLKPWVKEDRGSGAVDAGEGDEGNSTTLVDCIEELRTRYSE
jgi:hypothetical protein